MKADLDEIENQFKNMSIPNEQIVSWIPILVRELKAARKVISACENLLDLIVYYDTGSIELNGSCLFSLKESLQKYNEAVK